MFTKLILLALAGAAGTLARYGVYVVTLRIEPSGSHQAWATFAVNMVGSFLFGVVMGLASRGGLWGGEQTKLVILTGFMGAFTTFSTLAWETGEFAQGGRWGWAVLNMAGSAVVGTGLAVLGWWVAKG